jgi:DNA-binding response OmpR family regulator
MERKRILLVDDSATALMMEKMVLSRGPYELDTASDGEQAVAKAVASPPDLILLDIKMPKKDGLEALQELRNHQGTQAVPVIMVTTRGERENVDKAFDIGCDDYVTKPINGTELFSKIRDLIGT